MKNSKKLSKIIPKSRLKNLPKKKLSITERKQTEEKLRLFLHATESATVGIAIGNMEEKIIYVNHSFAKMFGYSRNELIGKEIPFLYPVEQLPKFKKAIKTTMEQGGWTGELIAKRKNGELIPIVVSSSVVLDDEGNVIAHMASHRDISEHKKAEEAIRESEECFQAIFENTGTATAIIEEDTTISLLNKGLVDLSGFSREEIEGKKKWTEFVLKEDLEMMKKQHGLRRKDLDAALKNYEFRFVDKGGEIKDILITIDMIPGTKKSVASLLDITERKRIEEALRESEEHYRMLIENQAEGIGIVDADENFVFANPAANEIFGCKKGNLIGRNLKEFTESKNFREIMKQTKVRKLGQKTTYELDIIREDNTRCNLLVTATPRFDNDKHFAGSFGIFRDITERKKVEDQLIKSETKYRSIVENTGVGIATTDLKGKFTYVNDKLCAMIGYTNEELFGKPFAVFLHPDERNRILKLFWNALKKPKGTLRLEFKVLHKKGHIVHMLSNPTILLHKGKITGFSALIQNITERKLAEKALKESLREKEVLLREIHHRVKNNLQVISSLINLQSKTIKNKKVLNIFKNSQDRIKSMALVHERLYKSMDLAHIDFGKYVKDITRQLFRTYGINPNILKITLTIEDILLDINTAIPCGLIINEIVTNSLKHAFPDGGKGKIVIALHSAKHNMFILTVGDNGTGLPKNLNLSNPKTLGLQLVNTLVEQIRGTIEIDTNHGTRFRIEFKKPKYKVLE